MELEPRPLQSSPGSWEGWGGDGWALSADCLGFRDQHSESPDLENEPEREHPP